MTKETQQKFYELASLLRKWNEEYYLYNAPSVDDATYDKTLRELIELEEVNPKIFDDKNYISPTVNVGSDLSEQSTFIKVKHEKPVLSLANAFNKEELLKFENDVNKIVNTKNTKIPKFVVEPKLDGSHIVLTYDNGNLVKAVTRGNGMIGEDITNNVKFVNGIPQKINFKEHLIVDGEILIKNSDFANINANLAEDEQYANSRNLASGSLKQKDVTKIRERKLTAFLYEASSPTTKFETQVSTLTFLKNQNFNIDTTLTKSFDDIETAWEYLEEMNIKKDKIDIPLDGMVLKTNLRSFYDEIGTTSKFPKYNIAYKFPPTIKQTIVEDIEVTVGRSGKITYVAVLKPVEIDGVMVSKVTLHNYDYIVEKDLRIGDTIELYRSGMVIPKVNKVVIEKRKLESKKYEMAKNCPCCETPIVKMEDDKVDFFCVNDDCESKLINKILHFTSRDAMNIEGMSIKTIEKLYKDGFIKNVLDLYNLSQYKDEIINNDYQIKDKTWNKLMLNIENSKTNSLERLLFGLGIKSVGKGMAKKIAKHFKTLENLTKGSIIELCEVEDVGETSALNIQEFCKNHLDLIDELKNIGINTEVEQNNNTIDETNQLFKKKFCITGSLETYNREELKTKIENEFGGVWTGGISKNLDILICGENAGSKLEKANNLKIKVIDENELKELLTVKSEEVKNIKKIKI